jgi:hypothetical protein
VVVTQAESSCYSCRSARNKGVLKSCAVSGSLDPLRIHKGAHLQSGSGVIIGVDLVGLRRSSVPWDCHFI